MRAQRRARAATPSSTPTTSAAPASMPITVSHQTPERVRRTPGIRKSSTELLHHDRLGVDVWAVPLGTAGGVVVHRDERVGARLELRHVDLELPGEELVLAPARCR